MGKMHIAFLILAATSAAMSFVVTEWMDAKLEEFDTYKKEESDDDQEVY